MSTRTFKVLIALSQDFTGISRLPRILKRNGIHISVLCAPHFMLSCSRFVDERFGCSQEPALAAETLREHLAQRPNTYAMVIPGDDPLLEALAKRSGENWVRDILPVDLNKVPASFVYSKSTFVQTFQNSTVPFPRSRVGTSLDEAVLAASELGQPFIFKEDSGFAGTGVRLLANIEDLKAFFDRRDVKTPWIIQQEIRGRIATTDVLFDRGVPRAWASSLVVQTRNGRFGSSSIRQFTTLPDIERILADVGRITGAHGMMGLDLIVDESCDRSVTLELNCRPTAGHGVAAQVGIDFGTFLAAQFRGEPPAEHAAPVGPTLIVPMFPEDLDRAITEKDWAALFKWACFPSYWKHMPWNDSTLLMRQFNDVRLRLTNWISRGMDQRSDKKAAKDGN